MKKIVIIVGVVIIILGVIFKKPIQKLFLSPEKIQAICSAHMDHESCTKDSWCNELEGPCPPSAPNCHNFICHAKP